MSSRARLVVARISPSLSITARPRSILALGKIFVVPSWKEIFKTDDERRHLYQQALEDYPLTLKAYRESGYELIEIPKGPVSARVDLILERVRVPEEIADSENAPFGEAHLSPVDKFCAGCLVSFDIDA